MNKVFAGAMMSIMALCVVGVALPLGGVNPEVAGPAYLCVAGLAFLWVGWLWIAKEASWSNSPMHWPVALFALYGVGRYFTSPVEYEAREELFLLGVCALIYFVAASYFHRPRDRVFFLIVLMVLAVFESGYGIWQALTNSNWVFFWERPPIYHGRASGTFIYPNQFASFLEMVLGLVLARAAYVSRESTSTERSVLLKVLTVYVVLMIVIALVLTRTRAAWFSATVGIVIFALLGDWRPRFTWFRLVLVLFVVAVVSVAVLRMESVKFRLERTFRVNDRGGPALGDSTLGGRTYMWKGTVAMIRDHPLFGTGIGSWQWVFQKYKDPRLPTHPEFAHNDILNLASDYGLVGFSLMGWVMWAFFRHARAVMRVPGGTAEQWAFAVGALVSISTLLVHCFFDFSLHIPVNAMLLAGILGLTAAMEASPRRIQRRTAIGRLPRYLAGGAVLLICGIGLWRFVPTALAFRYTDLANRLKTNLDYQNAFTFYDRAIDLDPNNPEPFIRIGDINRTGAGWRIGPNQKEQQREYALAAVEAYDRALMLNPHESFALIHRATMLDMAGKDQEAVKGFERAIEMDPANAYNYFLFGCYYRDHGDPKRAKELFQKSAEINFAFSVGLNTYDLEQEGQ